MVVVSASSSGSSLLAGRMPPFGLLAAWLLLLLLLFLLLLLLLLLEGMIGRFHRQSFRPPEARRRERESADGERARRPYRQRNDRPSVGRGRHVARFASNPTKRRVARPPLHRRTRYPNQPNRLDTLYSLHQLYNKGCCTCQIIQETDVQLEVRLLQTQRKEEASQQLHQDTYTTLPVAFTAPGETNSADEPFLSGDRFPCSSNPGRNMKKKEANLVSLLTIQGSLNAVLTSKVGFSGRLGCFTFLVHFYRSK